ncbi:unnamed protein product [Brachionus calyciflorus]|uniref:Large ribosomal subunit protein mL52 n=1 Tax=Brachionus calyciflorus TaxID=104777 RepID=A0A814CNM1_9BILA|nr:unnamed protein product [Brachionus calyciflorus]
MLKLNNLLVVNKKFSIVTKSNVSTSLILSAGKLWRQKVGLPKLQTARGPLIDLPDYSFTDGRPVPLSVGQVKRKETQERLANEVLEGLSYLNQAKQILNKASSKN